MRPMGLWQSLSCVCLRGATLVLVLTASSLFARAQSDPSFKPLDRKPWDFGIWADGGFSVPGGTKDTQIVSAGGRLGKVLTADHFPSFLRGNFEWSADLVPLCYVWQPVPAKNAYGEGFNPINLKWNFTSSPRIVPYLELGSGVLFTSHVVPLNTSHVNFVTHATLGFQFFNNDRRAFTTGILYEHISNAGLTVPNPGVNTVQFQIGLNWFR